jgi:hypothetical protein
MLKKALEEHKKLFANLSSLMISFGGPMEKWNMGHEYWLVFAPELLNTILRLIDPGLTTFKSFHLLIDRYFNSRNQWFTVSAYDTLLDLIRNRFQDSHVECSVSITAKEVFGWTPLQTWVRIIEHFESKRDEFRLCILLGSWVVQKRKAKVPVRLHRAWHSLSNSTVHK